MDTDKDTDTDTDHGTDPDPEQTGPEEIQYNYSNGGNIGQKSNILTKK